MILSTLEILSLLQLRRLGPAAVRTAIQSMEEVAEAPEHLRLGVLLEHVFGKKYAFSPEDYALAGEQAAEIMEACDTHRVVVMTYADELYPQRLRRIRQAPPVIYVKGNWKALNEKRTIAIVGTRQPTAFGQERAIWASETLANEQFVVVSGLALGCDTAAHIGTLKASGQTVAVLAHGLDTVSPSSNRRLAQEILDNGGALFSEYAPEVRAFPQNFIHRDRLQIGMAAGLLVIETDVQGGTMHTVGFCREQAKALACISHPAEWRRFEKTRGNQSLIEQRLAYEISNEDDLLNFAYHAIESEGSIGALNRKALRS